MKLEPFYVEEVRAALRAASQDELLRTSIPYLHALIAVLPLVLDEVESLREERDHLKALLQKALDGVPS